MNKAKKTNWGGVREGAGRRATFGEASTTLSMRVPASKKEIIKTMIEKQLKKWAV